MTRLSPRMLCMCSKRVMHSARKPVCLVRITVLLTVIFSSAFPIYAQDTRQDAALIPVAAIGEISEGERKIIENRLRAELTRY